MSQVGNTSYTLPPCFWDNWAWSLGFHETGHLEACAWFPLDFTLCTFCLDFSVPTPLACGSYQVKGWTRTTAVTMLDPYTRPPGNSLDFNLNPFTLTHWNHEYDHFSELRVLPANYLLRVALALPTHHSTGFISIRALIIMICCCLSPCCDSFKGNSPMICLSSLGPSAVSGTWCVK